MHMPRIIDLLWYLMLAISPMAFIMWYAKAVHIFLPND
jgi:hypothetical protein